MSKQIKKCVFLWLEKWLGISKSRMAAMPLHLIFPTYCRIDSFRVLRQSFCGKFLLVCRVWTPETPAFRMYGARPSDALMLSAQIIIKKNSLNLNSSLILTWDSSEWCITKLCRNLKKIPEYQDWDQPASRRGVWFTQKRTKVMRGSCVETVSWIRRIGRIGGRGWPSQFHVDPQSTH